MRAKETSLGFAGMWGFALTLSSLPQPCSMSPRVLTTPTPNQCAFAPGAWLLPVMHKLRLHFPVLLQVLRLLFTLSTEDSLGQGL